MQSQPRARTAAIVVTYHTGPRLDACLQRLCAEPDIDDVVVVDNGNPLEIEARLRAWADAQPKAKLLSGHGNVGFARGCNLGAVATQAERLLFINPDLVLQPGAAAALATALSASRRPCIAGGRVVSFEGVEQRGARREAITPWSTFVAFSGLSRLERVSRRFRSPFRERDPSPAGPVEVAAVSGALFGIAASDFRALGGFDEGYFLHVEDVDLCRRAQEAGGSVLFVPNAVGLHEGASSDAPRPFVERHKAAGYVRYFRKFARNPWERFEAAVMGVLLPRFMPMRWSVRRRTTK